MMKQAKVDTAKAMVRAYAEKNWSEAWSLAAPDILYNEVPTLRKAQGIRAFLALLQGWGAAFPDSEITIEDSQVSGDSVTFELHWTGTHEGPIESRGGMILPTGKKIDMPARMVVHVGEEKVKSVTHHFDVGALEKQLEITRDEDVA
jgi:predicted ester cyclase